jgi:hypothetical protein
MDLLVLFQPPRQEDGRHIGRVGLGGADVGDIDTWMKDANPTGGHTKVPLHEIGFTLGVHEHDRGPLKGALADRGVGFVSKTS